jgi:hypothetical protein
MYRIAVSSTVAAIGPMWPTLATVSKKTTRVTCRKEGRLHVQKFEQKWLRKIRIDFGNKPFNPTAPQNPAGILIDPPPSQDTVIGTKPLPTAQAEPLLEPPVWCLTL